jgi:glucose 1-dehydrogenase
VTRLHWVATRVHALTVEPGSADSLRLDDVSDPQRLRAELLVAGLAVGVCGTNKEIVRGDYGWPPPDRSRLINGHESLGRMLEAPSDSDFTASDLVVAVVRRPNPVPWQAAPHVEVLGPAQAVATVHDTHFGM